MFKTFEYEFAGPTRLDVALQKLMSDRSRTSIVELIACGKVLVNSKVCTKPSRQIFLKDLIQVTQDFSKLELDFSDHKFEFKIIFENDDFLVIDKPAKILSHPAATAKNQPSIVDFLRQKIPENILQSFDDHTRFGLVHRLDKDTSGLLLVAKNRDALFEFSKIFQSRLVTKKYLALAQGLCTKKEFLIEKSIGRSVKDPSKMSVGGIAAKPASSKVVLLEKIFHDSQKDSDAVSLFEVEIFTGRTHQIRVHLAFSGLRIVGDSVYGVRSDFIDRQSLHAVFLSFEFKKKRYDFHSELPEDILSCIENMRYLN